MSSIYRGGCEVFEKTTSGCHSLGSFQCEVETEPDGEVRDESAAVLTGVDAESIRRMHSSNARLIIQLDNELAAPFSVNATVPAGEPLPIVLLSAPANVRPEHAG